MTTMTTTTGRQGTATAARTEVSKRTSRRDRASRIPRPRCTGRCRPTCGRTCVRTYAAYNVGAAEGKNKVGVSRPRYVRACTRQREIRGHKPAYYAPPRATNTPNNGRGSARRSEWPVCVRVCIGMCARASRYRIKL